MKTLRFTYHMELRFTQPVTEHSFTFRCFPKSDDMQKITDRQMDIQPNSWTSYAVDSFGNDYVYGVNEPEHSRLYIGVSGHAQTGLADGIKAPELADCGIFLAKDRLTRPGASILKLDEKLRKEGLPESQTAGPAHSFSAGAAHGSCAGAAVYPGENGRDAEFICHAVYEYMTYMPGMTHFGTTADKACELRAGVCQDYAHIMLSLLRLHGIPCRYVAGILVGVGKSHAWVEVWQDGRWVGYDPTNNIKVTDQHISFARGRNCMDTLVNRGVFRGVAQQRMYVTATAVEVGIESYFSNV